MSTLRRDDLAPIYLPLRLAYGLVPLLAGMDKFFGILADWEAYLPPFASEVLPMTPTAFMRIVGVIEIVAGLAVLTALTRLGAYVVMLWLLLIAAAVAVAGHPDIAVRDVVMAVGAYTLGQVAGMRGERWLPGGAGHGAVSHASAH